jgi:protein transport protein SEC31
LCRPKRSSVLQWNPEVATQLVVGSDDDMAPALQLWDLRNSVSPLRELRGHRAGVLGLSWCPQDPAFLISSAKDNRSGLRTQTPSLFVSVAGSPAAGTIGI